MGNGMNRIKNLVLVSISLFNYAYSMNLFGLGDNKKIETTNNRVKTDITQRVTSNPTVKATDQRIFTSTGDICNSTVHIHANSAAIDSTKKLNSDNNYKLFFETLDKNKEAVVNKLMSLGNWIKNNKAKTFFMACGATLISMQIYLSSMVSKLNNENLWSKWKDHKSIKDLHKIPQGEIARELLQDIQKDYIEQKSAIDFNSSLTSFIREIDREVKLINGYKKCVDYVKTFYLDIFLFYNKKLYDSLDERLMRLSFIKGNFLAWVSEQKLKGGF